MISKRDREEPQVLGFVSVGLDNADGHKRVTESEHFLIVGGSAETHERMQDTAIRFAEALEKRGQRLEETPVELVLDLLRESRR